MPKKIAIATGTRADWGLLSPIARRLADSPNVEIAIMATNMHYDSKYGMTYKEIIADGFEIASEIPVFGSPAEISAKCLIEFNKAFSQINPDCVIILGDRFEMVAVAMAAVLAKVPIVHIAGGAISEGAFDDSFRHAITKMSTLHLTETEQYRQRVIQMGEFPENVVNTGAIGVYNAMNLSLMSKQELEKSIGFELGDESLLVTLHCATLEMLPPQIQMQNLLQALDTIPDCKILFTHPNNDSDAETLISMIDDYASKNSDRVCVVPSLGRLRYLSALRYVKGVVGNSSSGLVEVPSMGIPTLDIGIRQRGRTAGDSVLNCGTSADEITIGLKKILSPEMQQIASMAKNPYAQSDTLERMVSSILTFDFKKNASKRFYNINKI